MSKKSNENKRANPVKVKRPKLEKQPESENQHEKIKTKTRFFDKIKLWLKKSSNGIIIIFTVLAAIASCVAAYYAYLSHSESLPAQISVIFKSTDIFQSESTDLSLNPNRKVFLLLCSQYNIVHLGDFGGNAFPLICNETRKTIKDFKLEVIVKHNDLDFDKKYINPAFEIIEVDTIYNITKLLYKFNWLNPGERISAPIRKMYFVDNPRYHDRSDKYIIEFQYNISYDGMKEYEKLYVNCTAYSGKSSINMNDGYIDRFLTDCYSRGSIIYAVSPDVVAVQDESLCAHVAHPKDGLSNEEFANFKKEFIQRMRDKKGFKNTMSEK